MKRLVFILISILTAFLFFSFLSKTDSTRDKQVYVFYDKNIPEASIIVKDITSKIKDAGYKVETGYFEPSEINNYIISNPDALFVSNMPLQSNLFFLKKYDYLIVKVAVTKRNSPLNMITMGEFNELLISRDFSDEETIKKIEKKRMKYGIISFQNLTLNLKPLRVKGLFPTLANIKNGEYEKTYRANIYLKDNRILKDNPELLYEFGSWMEKSFSVIAGGDVMLTRGTEKYIKSSGAEYPFLKIREEIERHDIAFANLESPISGGGSKFAPYKGIYFKADPDVIEGLKFSGIDVFSLANNHALDWGIYAIIDTMKLLRNNGIQYTGVGKTRDEALKPAVINIEDTSVAFISFNDIYPFSITESGSKFQTLTLKGGNLKKEIESLKKKYDIVIASVHTGIEYVLEPENKKILKMRELIDYGVDIVLGSHPHVVQGIEVYEDGLIAYSLGNLIFDQDWSRETTLGLLLEISFLEGKPLYYYPHVITIEKAQAKITENNDDSEYILSYLNFEEDSNE